MSQVPREVIERLNAIKTQAEKEDDEKGLLSLVKTQDISKSMEPGGKVTIPRQQSQKFVAAKTPPPKPRIQYKPTTYVTAIAGAAGPKILQQAPLAAALPEATLKPSEPGAARPVPAVVDQKTPPATPQTTAAPSPAPQKSAKGLPIGATQPQKPIGPVPVTKAAVPYQSPAVSQVAKDASVKVQAKPVPTVPADQYKVTPAATGKPTGVGVVAQAGAPKQPPPIARTPPPAQPTIPAPQVKAPATLPPKPTTNQPPLYINQQASLL
ncbi:hypothetical protein TELCIR_17488 [Teladorsagia circumcincta]|uniref:Uncharacterized protein n=1 Tax=Teladorsagia circumcincta TaxID=45464 RepID=A0A2G9TSM0_TELCI|nr:hypothetical protein TELCIR_17488 [Teladorsagia circumcincta]